MIKETCKISFDRKLAGLWYAFIYQHLADGLGNSIDTVSNAEAIRSKETSGGKIPA